MSLETLRTLKENTSLFNYSEVQRNLNLRNLAERKVLSMVLNCNV